LIVASSFLISKITILIHTGFWETENVVQIQSCPRLADIKNYEQPLDLSMDLHVRHMNVTAKDNAFIYSNAYSEQYHLPSALADGCNSMFLIRPRQNLVQDSSLLSDGRAFALMVL
jgi:hypothetical protein